MKSRMLAIAGLATLIVSGVTYGVTAQAGAPVAGRPGHERNERHPELRQALRQLHTAANSLQHAAHDFGGHREKALDLTQNAIKEVEAALASDRK